MAKPGTDVAAALAQTKAWWQAQEIKKAAADQDKRQDAARTKAREAVSRASIRVAEDELALAQAMDKDPARDWAWRSLFAIFAVINFAGPAAISKIIEKWRDEEHLGTQTAQDDYKARQLSLMLRQSPATQKAAALQMLPSVLESLTKDGIPMDALAQADGAAAAAKAAERFSRSVGESRKKRGVLNRLTS